MNETWDWTSTYCTRVHISMRAHRHTYTRALLDMSRWCNPLVFPAFHIFFPLLCWDYAVVQSDSGPLSSDDGRWMTGGWVRQACSGCTVRWFAQHTVLAVNTQRCQICCCCHLFITVQVRDGIVQSQVCQEKCVWHQKASSGKEQDIHVWRKQIFKLNSCLKFSKHSCTEWAFIVLLQTACVLL